MREESRRHLPPPTSLAAFVAAARHGSFSRAAEAIGQTQSAVSRQIANLEAWLQIKLFHRHGPRVRLTPAGRAYMEEVAPALRMIADATRRVMAKGDSMTINLATLPSFGMRWLAPRLAGLTRRAPELIVNISARIAEFDFADEPFDAAIHFGKPDWPGVSHDRLFGERTIAVLSPRLIERHPVATPEDFLRLPLMTQAERPDAWRLWFDHAGISPAKIVKGPSFEHFTMLAQAATGGLGAALIPQFIIEEELASGSLVCPVEMSVPSSAAYYLVYPPSQVERPAFRLFRQWLLEVARGDEATI